MGAREVAAGALPFARDEQMSRRCIRAPRHALLTGPGAVAHKGARVAKECHKRGTKQRRTLLRRRRRVRCWPRRCARAHREAAVTRTRSVATDGGDQSRRSALHHNQV